MIAAPPLTVGQVVHIAPRAGRNVVADRSRWVDATVVAVTATGCSVRDSTGRLRSFGRRRDEVVAPGTASTKLIALLPPEAVGPGLPETLEALVSSAHKALAAFRDDRDFSMGVSPEQAQSLRDTVTLLQTLTKSSIDTRLKMRNG